MDTENTSNESTNYSVADEKELMIKKQYSTWASNMNVDESDEDYFIFKGAWELCTEYMMQVMRYALANQEQLKKDAENE